MIPLLLLAILPRIHEGGSDPAGYTKVPAPAAKMRMSEATATRVPWIDSNGWRYERGLKKVFYAALPKGAAPLAAAEAFAYGVDAVLQPDPADKAALGAMLEYLKSVDQAPMPVLANIGIIDDGSDVAGEAMNLLTRRNLMYRVVTAPDSSLNLTVKPAEQDARNPNEFAAHIREKLSDEKRLVRIYGSNVVIAHLTGDGKRARLHLLNYGRQPARDVRVRVLGNWKGTQPAQQDVEVVDNAIEFTVPEFATYAAVDLGQTRVMESVHSAQEFELTADPSQPQWASAPAVTMGLDFLAKPIGGPPTVVRSRWTSRNLYLLYSAPFDQLNLKPGPQTTADTVPLWDWDVVEAFLGSDRVHTGHYYEFEVSPQGEWVDLDIDRDHPKQQLGTGWNSGFAVHARIDRERHVWYGEMRIPFESIGVKSPEAGVELRAGLYRCAGQKPNRVYYAWSPTGQRNFHVPEAFGLLRLR